MENEEQESGEIVSSEEMIDIQPKSSSPLTKNENNSYSNELNIIFKDFQKKNKNFKDNILKFYNKRKENDNFFKELKSYITTNNNNINSNFITSIYNILYENDKDETPFEYFIEIIYIVSMNVHLGPSERLSSILFFSKYFNKNGNKNELFNLLLSLIKIENISSTIVNSIIQFLGSILSLSISLGLYNVLKLTYDWLIEFANQPKTTTTKELINQIINNINNNLKEKEIDMEIKKEIEKVDIFYISIKLLDILINDHLILNESSNNFENLPFNSFDFSSLLTSIIISHYLNPFNQTNSYINDSNKKEINYIELTVIPKLLSLLSNYWLYQTPQLLFKSNEKQSKPLNNINLLKEIITICIFSTYNNNSEKNELVEPYIIKLNSVLIDAIYQISECKNDHFSNLIIKNISNTLNPQFFMNIITKINDYNNNNKNDNTNNKKLVDRISTIIQIYSKTCKRINPDYLKTHIELLKQLNVQTQMSITILNQ
ncbi:hypothetical protein ACTFIU_011431 [Dictyostelium citrinum]